MRAVREAGLACAAAAPGPDPVRLNAGWKPPVLQRSR